MKNFLILILSLLIIPYSYCVSQTLTEFEKTEILNNLDDQNEWVRENAILKIVSFKIIESIPKLESLIWIDPEVRRSNYLWALSKLNYSDIIPLAYRFFDSIPNFRSYLTEKDILEYKVEATSVLFEHGDYSTAPVIFALRDSNTVFGNSITLDLLPEVIRHVPKYEQRAKEELFQIAFSSAEDVFTQNVAIRYLVELYGQEYFDEIAEVFINSGDTSVKLLMMDILERENYEGLKELYFDRLAIDTNTVIQFNIIEFLMNKYGSPSLSKEIKDILSGITDQKKKDILDLRRLYYKPTPPSDSTQIIDLIDNLDMLTEECYNAEWIHDISYFLYLKRIIQNGKDYLNNLDSIKCARSLDEFQTSIKNVFSDSVGSQPRYVSLDAQRFLYFYTLYILDRLPPLPFEEGFKIESISPTITITKTKDFTLTVYGSDFTKKSDVYFDGKKKKTKFISENELEADIKDKDIKKEGTYIVTVGEKKGEQTEGVEFKVYKDLPENIIPVLNCVEELDKKKYLAWFGYENYNDCIVYLDGKENELKGGKAVKGKGKDKEKGKGKGKYEGEQPVIFMPGVHENVFSVEFDKKKVTWELLKEKAEATEDSPPCVE